MWTGLRKEIAGICKDFALTDDEFRPLGLGEWEGVEEKIHQAFCKVTHHRSRMTWLWEHFKHDTFAVTTTRSPYLYLDRLVPAGETIWFFVNETINESEKFWLYQGQVGAIQTVIGEACLLDEIYLASKHYTWILCINHHDVLIASGEAMPGRLRALWEGMQGEGE